MHKHAAGTYYISRIRLKGSYYRGNFVRRLCGLILFSMGSGMTLILIFPKNFLWVCIAGLCLIAGYNLFCCR